VTATVDRTSVTTDDAVRFEVEIVGATLDEVAMPVLPPLDGLTAEQATPAAAAEEATGQPPRVVFRWTLRPARPGAARIGAAMVRHAGGLVRTAPLGVTVRPGSGPPPAAADPDAAPFAQGPPRTSRLGEGDVVLRASASTLRTVVGAQVVVEYRLFARPDVDLRFSPAGNWNPVGFWREDLAVPPRPLPQPATLDGRRYSSIVVQRTALFPTQAGRLDVPPLTLEGEADVPTAGALRGPRRSTSFRVASAPLRLIVEALDAPPDFSGLAGAVRLDAAFDDPQTAAGRAVRLRVRVAGDANLSALAAPMLTPPDSSFEVFEPESDLQAIRTGGRLTATRTFTYSVVPRRAGSFRFPPVTLVVYDVAQRRFLTLRAEPGVLTVGAGDEGAANTARTGEGASGERKERRSGSVGLLVALGLLAAGGLAWAVWRWAMRPGLAPADPPAAPPASPEAARRPADPLGSAHAALDAGDVRQAATLAAGVLDAALSRRLGRDLRRLSPDARDAALDALPGRIRLRDLRFRLDAARFAPVAPDADALRRDLDAVRTIADDTR
jgi:hypothetical protein